MIVGMADRRIPRRSTCRTRDGKTYYVMTDAAGVPREAWRLLAEVQRIKSEGDYDGARALFRDMRNPFRPGACRDEVVARVDALQLPSYTAIVHAAIRRRVIATARSSMSRFPIHATWRRRCSSIPRSRAPPMPSRRLRASR